MPFQVSRSSVHIVARSEEHTSELQSQSNLVCRLLLEKKNTNYYVSKLTKQARGLSQMLIYWRSCGRAPTLAHGRVRAGRQGRAVRRTPALLSAHPVRR